MIKVGNALKIILKEAKSLPKEKVKLTQALNRVLAEDIYARIDIPQLDNSAMDGYAIRSSDIRDASQSKPKILEVIEDLKAGDLPLRMVKKNQAIRIMTGAPIPKGADSVVIVENTRKIKNEKLKIPALPAGRKNKDFVEVFKGVERGENIRRRGEDIKKGERVLKKGTLLNSAHIGMLASLGKATIKVTKKPKVAILATGDEVIDVNEKLKRGKLRSSNTYTLYGQVLECGGIPKNLGIAKDEPKEVERKIKQGLDCDMILTSGGVSVGDYDFVKDVLAKLGTDIKFWKVRMRPGKPLVFGVVSRPGKKRIPIFGLPGNPVSSMISFETFVKPTLSKMLGEKHGLNKESTAILEEPVKKKKGFRYFLRAKTYLRNGSFYTHRTGPQGSGILKSMALANSIIILPEEKENPKRGEEVKVRFLD